MQDTSPLFNNPLLHSTIELRRIKIFKMGFKKLSILSKFWEWHKWQGVGGHLICVIMTHCVRKWICASPLNEFTLYLWVIKELYEKGSQKIAVLSRLSGDLHSSKKKNFNSIIKFQFNYCPHARKHRIKW